MALRNVITEWLRPEIRHCPEISGGKFELGEGDNREKWETAINMYFYVLTFEDIVVVFTTFLICRVSNRFLPENHVHLVCGMTVDI